jgi:response regulator RpfG family c-di-GMP phosphodiesterase
MGAPRILVVDDDAAMAALIAQVLGLAGYAVVELTHACDALARARSRKGESFLQKPFSLESLTEAVSLALHGTTSPPRSGSVR